MYKISKVKQWIKKSSKDKLIYDTSTELVTDTYVMLKVVPEMKPALLEAFGHLDGGGLPEGQAIPAAMATIMELKPDAKVLVDSTLMFEEDSPYYKGNIRVLYCPDTGQKICIKQVYVDLFKNFSSCRLMADNDGMKVYVLSNTEEVIGVMTSFRPASKVLMSFEFKDVAV